MLAFKLGGLDCDIDHLDLVVVIKFITEAVLLVLSETEKLKIFAEELCKERKDLLSIFSLS